MASAVQKKHQNLKELIRQQDHNYYVLDRPQMTDFQYDQLMADLMTLEADHPELDRSDSPSQRVGGQALDVFKKVSHRRPMLSLANSYSPEDLIDFNTRVKKVLGSEKEVEYFCELKFDGLAIELIYENGILVQALTRGDGAVGEDVTHNIKTVKAIPLVLTAKKPPALLEVRGEILMYKNDFLKLNEAQQENGQNVFANPRNAAAGTIRQLDSKISAQRSLRFFAYSIGEIDGVSFSTQEELEIQFSNWSLPVALEFTRKSTGPDGVVDFYRWIEKKRHALPFDIDGIVVKVNSFRLQDDLGLVARNPRWATAAKFQPEQAQTVIQDIEVQVGRTGALTPRAVMTPTKVGGVIVTYATLHNQEEIQRKDVRIGDSVILQRAGDVIPEVVSVILEKRPKNSAAFKMPAQCPACGTATLKLEDEVITRCPNPFCKAVLKESLKHFAGRRAMNIEKVGDRLIETFVDEGLVEKFSDLYRLNKDVLLSLDRQGEKSVDNILESIEKSKLTTLAKFIFSLGIRYVGEQTAKFLADHYLSVENLEKASGEDLLAVPEIGPKVALSIRDWFQNKRLVAEIHALQKLGVQIEAPRRSTEGKLSGLSFVITGTLPVKRDDAKDLIEKNGGKILSGVSSKLHYLVAGDDPGSKIDKASTLRVKVISWDELLKLL